MPKRTCPTRAEKRLFDALFKTVCYRGSKQVQTIACRKCGAILYNADTEGDVKSMTLVSGLSIHIMLWHPELDEAAAKRFEKEGGDK